MVHTYIRKALALLQRDEKGISALEYAILATGIVLVVMGVVFGLGTSLSKIFTTVSNSI
jgi:Flp pilus assembly pilin Flp